MPGLAWLILSVAVFLPPAPLEPGTDEIPNDMVVMPVRLDPAQAGSIVKVRLFVSEDRGKTWEHSDDFDPADREVKFFAPHDGLYWFAVQVELFGGRREPADPLFFTPDAKVYVNTSRKVFPPAESEKEPGQEVRDLRQPAEQPTRPGRLPESGGRKVSPLEARHASD